jgi:hypothetical protein
VESALSVGERAREEAVDLVRGQWESCESWIFLILKEQKEVLFWYWWCWWCLGLVLFVLGSRLQHTNTLANFSTMPHKVVSS